MPMRFAPVLAVLLSFLTPPANSVEAIEQPLVSMPVEFSSVMALPARSPDSEWRYGTAESQRAYLWLPPSKSRPAPVVVLLHGGCWLAEYKVDHIYPLASALASKGYAVWAPEYRRVGETGGGWPGTFEDVAASVDFLATVESGNLDLEHVVLAGHSAGGQLALWAAARTSNSLGGPPRIQSMAAIGLAAIVDLKAYAAGDNSCEQITEQLMGGSPEQQPQRYRLASPAALDPVVPIYLLQGSVDPIVAPRQTRTLAAANVTLIPGAGHFDLIHPGTAAFPTIVELLDKLTQP